MQTIYDIIEETGNYIIAANQDLQLLVTVNHVYIQIWRYSGSVGYGEETYEAIEALYIDNGDKLHEKTFEQVVDDTKRRADEFLTDQENEKLDADEEPLEYGTFFPID